MKDIYLGRQPIYDRDLRVAGFELLYRQDEVNAAGFSDAGVATNRVILNTLAELGLETVVGDRLAFFNVSRNFVVGGGLDALAGSLALPASRLIFEVKPDVATDERLLAAMQALVARGRRFALDDYVDDAAGRQLLAVAGHVKVDLLTTAPEDVRRLATELRGRGRVLIAERIETAGAYELCRRLDFDLYQGFHFAQPKVVRVRTLPSNQAATLQLLGKLNDANATVAEIEALVSQDVSLSYKVLRHINSAYFGLPRRVDSIHRAVALLGLDNIRAWASLIALANAGGIPGDLPTTALMRGLMCEALVDDEAEARPAFSTGLLSTLDAYTGMSMEQALRPLPLHRDIEDALLHHEGPLGRVLACVLAYERADWEAVDASDLDPERVSEAYFSALTRAYRAALERM